MINKIFELLFEAYGHQGWWPIIREEQCVYDGTAPNNQEEVFEISVGAILTQNTQWDPNVVTSLVSLKSRDLLSVDEIRNVDQDKLSQLIKSSGYNNQKARKLKELVAFLDSNKAITREHLLEVWGIGPETADSILLYAHNQPVFIIDAYTKRIMSRIGLCKPNTSYDDLQKIFLTGLEHNTKVFKEYHALLVTHAKKHCKSKPDCTSCPLNQSCQRNI